MADERKDEERDEEKGAGAAPWMRAAKAPATHGWRGLGLGARGAGGMAVRGAGGLAGDGAALLRGGLWPALKTLLASNPALFFTLAAGLAVSGYGLYDMAQRGGFGMSAREAGRVRFTARQDAGDGSGAADAAAKPASSLDLAHQANPGAFNGGAAAVPEKTAEAIPADEFPASDPAAAAATADAAAAAQGAQAPGAGDADGAAKGSLAAKFGKLRDNIGGGMTGGGGLSGGVYQPFSPRAKSQSGVQTDKLTGLAAGRKTQVSRGKQPAQGVGRSSMKSATAQKLSKMQGSMANASNANPETSAAVHSREWENAGSVGQGITGAGASGIGTDGGPGSDAAGLQNGGPTNENTTPSSASEAPEPANTENKTPYQGLIDVATLLLAVATMISLIIAVLAKTGVGLPIAVMLCKVNVGLGAIVALMGMGIMMQGQMLQGGLFTTVGSIIAVCSYAAIGGSGQEVALSSNAAALSVAATIAGLLGTSLGIMGRSGGSSGDSGK